MPERMGIPIAISQNGAVETGVERKGRERTRARNLFWFAQTLVAGCPSVAVDLSAGEMMPASTLENSQ
jgi:hypothetical protein